MPNQAAIEMVASLAEETEAGCQFERAPAYVYTLTPDERGAIEAEHEAAIGLGLPATLTNDVDLPFPVEVALRFDDQAYFHPSRYTAALARSVAARGGHVFEHTRATRVVERSHDAIVETAHGKVRAERVVLTTLLPFVDIGGFFAKVRREPCLRSRSPPPWRGTDRYAHQRRIRPAPHARGSEVTAQD